MENPYVIQGAEPCRRQAWRWSRDEGRQMTWTTSRRLEDQKLIG